MKCSICGIRIDSVDDAAENGWTPYFYDGTQRHDVACPSCSKTLLQQGQDGELEVKEQYSGKINFLDNRNPKEPREHLLIGLAVVEKNGSVN